MRVTLINVAKCPSVGSCEKCKNEMAHINQLENDKILVRCVGCGLVRGTTDASNLYHNCPKCYEAKLNLDTGYCESCGADADIEFLRPANVTYNDPEREYKAKGMVKE